MAIKSVAIIGGGPSGLVAAKEAKENGLDPTVFEKGTSIGGLWTPDGGVWEEMKANNYFRTICFSDFPWPSNKKPEEFPTARQVHEYLIAYANHFDLIKNTYLRSQVTLVQRTDDKWTVTWILNESSMRSRDFDAVMVCSGFFSKAYIPPIEGIEELPKYFHAKDYRRPDLIGREVVAVVGNAFSGCEIASQLAKTAAKVYHVFERTPWVLTRYIAETGKSHIKQPIDLTNTRAKAQPKDPNTRNQRVHKAFSQLCHRQPEMGLSFPPEANPYYVTTSDNYLPKVEDKSIELKQGKISKVENKKLVFEDGSSIEVNAVIFCTGYRTKLPFFSDDILAKLDFQKDDPLMPLALHHTIFHPEFPNGAFIGENRFGMFGPPIELQARLATLALSGKIPYPSEIEMRQGIADEKASVAHRPQFAHDNVIRFCDDLAKIIGVLPDFEKLKTEDPSLWEKLMNGPFTTASYRLVGPGSKPDQARKTLDEISALVKNPLKNPECVYNAE